MQKLEVGVRDFFFCAPLTAMYIIRLDYVKIAEGLGKRGRTRRPQPSRRRTQALKIAL